MTPIDPEQPSVPTQRIYFSRGKGLPWRISVGDRIRVSYVGPVTSISDSEYGSDIGVETEDVVVSPMTLDDAAKAAEQSLNVRGATSPFTFSGGQAVRPQGSS